MSKKPRDPSIRLTPMRRLAFAMGLGGGGIVAAIGSLLLGYYTNVIHISAGVAGTILAVSKLLDGVSDLIAGRIVDRTKSRFGKGRPWLLRMALPALITFIMLFSVPTGSTAGFQIAYIFITYNLFTTVCFTMISVAYSSMQSLVTDNQKERNINVVLGMTIYTVAMLIISTQFLKMTTAFGGGEVYSPAGWTKTGIVVAVAYTLCIFIVFLFAKEMEDRARTAGSGTQIASVGKTLKALLHNKYWVEYVIALVTNGIGNTFTMGAALYYCQFILGDVQGYSTVSAALYIAMFLGILATFLFINRIGKRNTAILGLVILLLGTVAAAVLPKTTMNTLVTIIIRGFGCGFPSALGTAVLQDTLTYGRWKSGFDMVGMGNAACTFTSKVGTGLGTAALGWVLDLGGYDGALAVQSESAKTAIVASFTWIPIAFVLATLICFIIYKLDKEYDFYAGELAAGRYGPDAELPQDE